MLGIAAEIINRRLSDCRALNWIVLLSFLLNVPVFLGYERILPHYLASPVPSGTDCASLAEYVSIALAPIFLVDLAGWMRYICSWKKSSGKSGSELMAAVSAPTRMRWSSGSLGYIVGQIASALLLTANLFEDVCSGLALAFAVHGFTVGAFAVAIVGVGGFIGFLGSLKYCFVYWKASKADAAIESVLN